MRCGRKWAAARLTAKGLLQLSASLVQTSYAQVYPRTFPPTLSFTLPALVESARHLVLLSAATGGESVWRPSFTISLTFHSRCLWFASSYNSGDTIVANTPEQAAHRLQVNHPAPGYTVQLGLLHTVRLSMSTAISYCCQQLHRKMFLRPPSLLIINLCISN